MKSTLSKQEKENGEKEEIIENEQQNEEEQKESEKIDFEENEERKNQEKQLENEEEDTENASNQSKNEKNENSENQNQEKTDEEIEEELRASILKAIKSKKYQESKKLQQELDDHLEKVFQKRIEEESNNLAQTVNDLAKEYKENSKNLESSKSFRNEPVCVSTNESFELVKQSQIKQLADLELAKEFELIKAKETKTAEVLQLEKSAFSLAKQKQFEEADAIQRKADKLHQKNEKIARGKIEKTFAEKENKLLDSFRKELKIIIEKHESMKANVEESVADLIVLEQKKFNVKIKELIKASIKRAVQSNNNNSDKKKAKNQVIISREKQQKAANQLTAVARRTLVENKLIDLVDI